MVSFAEYLCLGLILILHPGIAESVKRINLFKRPYGQILEGDTVYIICEALDKSPLDIIQLIKLINETEYTITTNDIVRDAFRQTGRYHITEWKDSGYVELQITHILGIDGGNIGCRHLQGTAKVFMDVIVQVPVSSVELHYEMTDGKWSRALENSRIQITGKVSCNVSVIGSNFKPEVRISVDETDVTSRFQKNSFQVEESSNGFVNSLYSANYESTLKDIESASAGKNLTCWAKTEYHEPKFSSVIINMTQKPHLKCVKFWNGRVAQRNMTLTCQGKMNPGPEKVAWLASNKLIYSAAIGRDSSPLQHTVNQEGNYSSSVKQMDNGRYEFGLHILELTKDDFTEYILQVTNEVGFSHISIQLLEGGSAENIPIKKIDFPETGESSAIVLGSASSSSSESEASSAVIHRQPKSIVLSILEALLITLLYVSVSC